jgi:hypothetical protein
VLEDVERIGLVEGRVPEGKKAHVAPGEIHRSQGLGREVRAGIDAHELAAARSLKKTNRPLPQPMSRTRSSGPGLSIFVIMSIFTRAERKSGGSRPAR